MKDAYPLCWPEGWPRTPNSKRVPNNSWKYGFGRYLQDLLAELRMLDARNVIVSSNMRLRSDGLPAATQREPEDGGTAVYFDFHKRPMCFACDKYTLARWNLHAIGLTIAAIRTIERNGASDMMERAFTGFMALPEKASQAWREVLSLRNDPVTLAGVEARFRELVRVYHPDVLATGDRDKYEAVVQAREDARRELGQGQ